MSAGFAAAETPNECAKLLQHKLPHGAIAYDKIDWDELHAEFDRNLAEVARRTEALRNDPAKPSFVNTIEVLETLSEPVDLIAILALENFKLMESSKGVEKLAGAIGSKVAKFSDDVWHVPSIWMDEKVFARVDEVYKNRAAFNLNVEQLRLLDKYHAQFVRNGAGLSDTKKSRLVEIDKLVSEATLKFEDNVKAARNDYKLLIPDVGQLKGLPESALGAAAQDAAKAGHPGQYLITVPITTAALMTYADDRRLREMVWRSLSRLNTSGELDNRPVLLKIAQLRQERALILKYASHADFLLEERMANTPAKVHAFLDRLIAGFRPKAEAEFADLTQLAGHVIEPWDTAYYAMKLQEKRFGFNGEDLRPYLGYDNVLKGAFFAAEKAYKIKFNERHDLPIWNKDVRVFDVTDADGKFLSLLYLDPFPREAKQTGAWSAQLVSGGEFAGQPRRPHVANVGNYTPPVGNKPALLTMRDVTTIFHELGHGLHAMLSQARYRSLAGTNVALDFVELPSQLNEAWAEDPEVMKIYARHYQTGEPIPQELIAKMKAAKNFMVGLAGLRASVQSKLDLAWHSDIPLAGLKADAVEGFEASVRNKYELVPSRQSMISPTFLHIFAHDYSAGYYSYAWSDAMVADMLTLFTERGMFDEATAQLYKKQILEQGGAESPEVLFRNVRGRDLDPSALLKLKGIDD